MSSGGVPDPLEPPVVELEGRPTAPGRVARLVERARVARAHVEDARARHGTVDVGFHVIERDSTIGGGLLAGALAYRLFVVLLPAALLLVSGLGLYAGVADRPPAQVANEAGLTGLIAAEVASAASSGARWVIFLVMVPTILYALVQLYRAIAVVYAIVWDGSGRGVHVTRRGVGFFIGAMVLHFVALEIVSWIRRDAQFPNVATLFVYLVFVGGAWLVVSTQLPHRELRWPRLVPGAALFGVGLLFINVFNVYVTTRLVEGRSDTYGALGVATALLFSLVLVGRLMVASAVLNASLDERRVGNRGT